MQALLLDKDALELLAEQLTREEAGLLLAPLCRAAAAFVRAADKAAVNDAGATAAAVFRQGPPMWCLERTYERLEMKYAVDGEEPGGLELVLRSLATEIEQLRQEGICELEFNFAKACAGKKTCLLGCHALYVHEPVKFLVRLSPEHSSPGTISPALASRTSERPPSSGTERRACRSITRWCGRTRERRT
jgi:hypothetical protein